MSEVGHAKNAANFETLIYFVAAYGATSNPSKAELDVSKLTALLVQAKSSLTVVNNKRSVSTDSINQRELVFEPLNKLTTRIGNALSVSVVDSLIADDARSIINKIQGKRATPKATPDPAIPSANQPKTVSTSQMSYDQRVESFDRLIKVLEEQSGYTPNETELQTGTLNTNLTDMRAKNTAVVNSGVDLSNSRLSRNDLLYADDKGLVKTAQDVKKYVKSVFGVTSPQFKQISGLKFTTPKS
jgi:hypothetical protein